MTEKSTTIYELHGRQISDPYRWLEDLDSEDTRAWVEFQNARTSAFLDAVPESEAIRKRVTELWNYQRCGLPFKEGQSYFFLKNDGLQNQAVLHVADGREGEPRVLLDPNTLSSDGTVALTSTEVSRDGKLLAYGLSRAGSDWEQWHVRDVATGRDLSDQIDWVKFSNTTWTTDGLGFFYCRYDEPKSDEMYEGQNYFHKLYYHRVGTSQAEDELVYQRLDQKEWNFDVAVSDDGQYLIIHVWAATHKNLVFYRSLQPKGDVVELIPVFEGRYQFIGNDGPVFLLLTDAGAPRGKVVAIDVREPERSQWRDVIPEAAHTLERVTTVGQFLVAVYLSDAHTQVKIFDRKGSFVRDVELPGLGTANGFSGHTADSETFFDFTSFTTPSTVFRYNIVTGDRSVFHKPPLLFDPEQFETTQVFYSSRDGTRIPMFVTYKRGLKLDGTHPAELYGYGGFGISLTPGFSPARIAWMEMGGIVAVANLRGGGEYGEDWHQAGTKSRKQNVFDDFIAAAEWLIEHGYTSPGKLAITGRSNGGLLVGACMTQRPDLFGAAIPGVGVMDMLRFHKFTIGWSWVSDYGSPDDSEDFKSLVAYSPYHNLRPGTHYPATLVTTGDHDDRVVPGHSYKFAAALQAAQAGSAPALIRIDVRAGHGTGKPISKQIGEVADILSFMVKVLA